MALSSSAARTIASGPLSPSRRSLRRAAAALLAVVAVTACSGSAAEAEVADVTWTLTELEGAAALPEATVDLTLTADGTVSGSAGCNQYTGSATFADGEMTLGPNLASTMMACEDPIMAQESAFLAALERVSGYEVGDGELRLTDSDGNVLARFE
jgi:heat shock protein HslJ